MAAGNELHVVNGKILVHRVGVLHSRDAQRHKVARMRHIDRDVDLRLVAIDRAAFIHALVRHEHPLPHNDIIGIHASALVVVSVNLDEVKVDPNEIVRCLRHIVSPLHLL